MQLNAYKWEISKKQILKIELIIFLMKSLILKNIKDFDPSLLKIDKKTYKNIGIYYIGYITMKDSDHVKINSVNPLYISINEVDGSVAEKNGNKYLIFASIDKKKY